MNRKLVAFFLAFSVASSSQAIIIIPIPNLGFPPALGKIRDALEKSTDTKALATVGEDKTFGSRYWVWGHSAGKMTQADADSAAMRGCETSLTTAKSQTAGSQPLYDFGKNRCELYKFANVTVNLPVAVTLDVAQPSTPQSTAVAVIIDTPVPMQQPSATPAIEIAPVQRNAQQNAAGPTSDIVSKMRDLDALYRQSLISKEEYEKKKKQLLDAL